MSQSQSNKDFRSPPTYKQNFQSNDCFTSVTTTRTDPDGTITQHFKIIAKK